MRSSSGETTDWIATDAPECRVAAPAGLKNRPSWRSPLYGKLDLDGGPADMIADNAKFPSIMRFKATFTSCTVTRREIAASPGLLDLRQAEDLLREPATSAETFPFYDSTRSLIS